MVSGGVSTNHVGGAAQFLFCRNTTSRYFLPVKLLENFAIMSPLENFNIKDTKKYCSIPPSGTPRASSPTILNLQQTPSTANNVRPYISFWQVPAAAKSLRSLRIYIALRDRKAVQILFPRYHFYLISDFYMLLILQSAPCRLAPNEALPHTPLGALPLDPTSPLAPGLSVRFISHFARCFILLYACNLLWSAMLIPHSSFLISHSSLLT